MQFSRNIVSLEEPLNAEGDLIFGDTIPQDSIASAEEMVLAANRKQFLSSLIRSLTGKEAIVLRMRFGLEDEEPMTLQEIGEKLGLCRERIRQIERQSIDKLRLLVSSRSCAN